MSEKLSSRKQCKKICASFLIKVLQNVLVKHKEPETTKSLFTFWLSPLQCFQGGNGSHFAFRKPKPQKHLHWSGLCTENLPLICFMNREIIFGPYAALVEFHNLSRICWHFKSPLAKCREKQFIQCQKSRLHF